LSFAENCTDDLVGENDYSIINSGTGYALDISGSGMDNGANVTQWRYKASRNQQFHLTDLGNGYWSIKALHSGRAVDVAGRSVADGANILQWDYHGANNQQWQLQRSDAGSYAVISRNSGKVMSVADTGMGGNVFQQSDRGSPNQLWYFNPVDNSCGTTADPKSAGDNIAPLATASTSYVSDWETLSAVNDDSNPANSNDKSDGAYGNWYNPNSIQWVQYDWPQNYKLSSTEIYWFDDNGGVLVPTTAYFEYWNGNTWVRAGNFSLKKDTFNELTLNDVVTSRVRVSMLNNKESTGILEWRIIGTADNDPTPTPEPTPIGECSPGSRETQWASHCPAQQPRQCVGGQWQAPIDGGETGAPLRMETEHFAIYWKDGTNITMSAAQNAANTLEEIWNGYFGAPVYFPEPYCNSGSKWKAAVHFDNDFPLWGGGWGRNGINYMGMWIGPGAASDTWGLAHEFMHGVQSTTQGFGDCGGVGCWIYESHANWMPHQLFRNEAHCSEMLINAPHLYYGNTRDRYCNWQFFEYLKDTQCPSAVNDMWAYEAPAGQRDPWRKLMASQSWDIEQLNDQFGEWAMHNVTFDYRDPDGNDQGALYRRTYGLLNQDAQSYTQRRLRVTRLESLDSDWAQNRRFVSPYYWAPQRWGYNVVRLYPENGASSVRVSFRGVLQQGADSGWRWGLVATNSSMTNPRYSELQRGTDGELDFCISPGEELYLVILAAPTNYQKITWDNPSDGRAYPSIYRYPYMIEVAGAWPEGFRNGTVDACPSGTVRHENGGGCATGNTPSSVFVGPYAKVLGGNVSGDARIEDQATVINGNVNGGTVGAMSLIGVNGNPHHGAAGFNVRDNAVVQSTFYPMGWYGNGLTASGSARMVGDLEVYSSKSNNIFYGLVNNDWNGVSNIDEVTIKPPYYWRP